MVTEESIEEGYELTITRTFDAPRELVWKAWTDPSMAMHWMGPRGFKATEFVASTEAGGAWSLRMQGNIPGTEQMAYLAQGGKTLEFDPPKKLVYTFAWSDRSLVGLPPSPYKENIVTVRFEEDGDKTVMHFTQGPFATESECNGHTGGWNSAFDRFAEFMLSEAPARTPKADEVPSELHLRRFFAAPRELVFDAWTKAEILAQWWGPKCFTNPRCEVDARAGGEIRIDMQSPDGTIYPMQGKFIQILPPYRFHFTSSPLDKDGKPVFETWTSVVFEEKEGGTEVILDVHVTSTTAQAPQYLKGMNAGWNQSLDRLNEVVASKGDA
ncbi:MAG TPA: SRPBCC domain-containing protein [Acidobacteriaceae bacterium]|jgi:uncharacterized protein YndB with AHSA1/START domain